MSANLESEPAGMSSGVHQEDDDSWSQGGRIEDDVWISMTVISTFSRQSRKTGSNDVSEQVEYLFERFNVEIFRDETNDEVCTMVDWDKNRKDMFR